MSERLGPGSTFAGCRLEAVAGRGGMGVVYRATQLALGRSVALKAIAPELAEDQEYRERFQRESHLAASIDHPNVIPVYEAGESEGTLYLIMRWVEGIDLRTLLASSGRIAPPRTLRLLRQVASALSAAHRRGLVHRDVKPANVLITRGDEDGDEHVYLTDFGIARRAAGDTAMTRTGTFVGTIDYTAPERITGGRGDATSDIYSLGCVLFETLTGHVPFDRPTDVSKIFAHVNDPVPSAHTEVSSVPAQFDEIIEKAMAKRPEDRFSSAGELAAVLGRILQELETVERQVAARPAGAQAPAAPTKVRTEDAPVARAVPSPFGTGPATVVPPAPPRSLRAARRSRLLPALLLVALAVVLAVVLIPLLASSGGGGDGSSTVSSSAGGSGTRIHAVGLSAGQTITLGSAPGAISVIPLGGLWISLPDRGAVVRVNPATGRSTSFAVGGRPTWIAAGSSGVWVANSAPASVVRLNARTGAQIASATLRASATALATSRTTGAAWVADGSGEISHIGLDGAVLGSLTSVTPAATGIGSGEGWVWATNGDTRGLIRVSPQGGSSARFDAGPGTIAVTFDQGVWTAHSNGHVTRFDPRPDRLQVNSDLPVAPELDGIAAVEQQPSVWAISKRTMTLYRISNTSQPAVTGTVAFSSAPTALAVGERSVWVATGDGKVTQILY